MYGNLYYIYTTDINALCSCFMGLFLSRISLWRQNLMRDFAVLYFGKVKFENLCFFESVDLVIDSIFLPMELKPKRNEPFKTIAC